MTHSTADLSRHARLSLATLVTAPAVFLAAACTGEAPGDGPTPASAGTVPAAAAPAVEDHVNTGVSEKLVLFGQSAAFTGPAQALGHAMRMGIEAAFHERNEAGGVHGRMLELVTMDDRYEPGFAYANTRDLIAKEKVFGLIGAVGTPTSRSAAAWSTPRRCRSWRRSRVRASCGIPSWSRS